MRVNIRRFAHQKTDGIGWWEKKKKEKKGPKKKKWRGKPGGKEGSGNRRGHDDATGAGR